MHEPLQVEKTDLIGVTDGCEHWATNDPDIGVMEWESEIACQVAFRLQELIKKHALSTNFLDRLGNHALIVRQLQLLPVLLVPRCTVHDTHLEISDGAGTLLEKREAKLLSGVTHSRLEVMVDTATHVARSVRAHLAGAGVTALSMPMRFGLGGQGECLLQVINPLACDLGLKDMSALYKQLGGEFG